MSLAQASSGATPVADPQRSLNDALASFRSVLSVDQQEALKNSPAETDVDKVMVFTAELDQKAKGMRGPSVATRLHAVLEAVHLFSTVVDTFVSSNPEIAALVWGSIKMTMLIMTNYTSYFAPLSKLFMTISTHCPRFTEYQALFPLSVRLQQALCDFHAAIVRCCQHVIQCLKRTWSQHFLKAILQSFDQEFKPDLDEIAKLASEVKEEVTLVTISALRQEQLVQSRERKASSLSRSLLRKHMPKMHEDLRAMQARYSRREREALLTRLSAVDHLLLFKDACKKRRNGTAEWILKDTRFKQWHSGIGPRVLCCHGKIGSGKTVLCTNVINHLFLQKRGRTTLAFFLAQDDLAESLLAETMLRSILSQAITASESPVRFMGELTKLLDKPYTSFAEWTVLLQQVVAGVDQACIVVDGLDACTVSERRALLHELSSVVAATPHLYVFLCGQDSMLLDAERAFPIAKISTASAGLRADIALYVEQVLEENFKNGDMIINDPSLRELVVATLNERADDMFLLVVYLMQELCVASYNNSIIPALAKLPRDLEGVYGLVLGRIIASNTMVEAVRTALHWTMAAQRPLTVEELQEAISIDIKQPHSMPEKHIPNFGRIILWSGNLLQCSEEEPRTIRVAHSTIRDFLRTESLPASLGGFQFEPEVMDHHLGEICMTYLDLSDFRTEVGTRREKELVSFLPLPIARTALGSQSMAAQIMKLSAKLAALRGQPTQAAFDFDISHLSSTPQPRHNKHAFLKYAQTHWLTHTTCFTKTRSAQWALFRQIPSEGHHLALWSGHKHTKPTKAHLREFLQNNDHYAIFLVAIERWLLFDSRCPNCHYACFDVEHKPMEDMEIVDRYLHERSPAELGEFLSATWRGDVPIRDALTVLLAKTGISKLDISDSTDVDWRRHYTWNMELIRACELGSYQRVIHFLEPDNAPPRFEKSLSTSRENLWRLNTALIQAVKNGHENIVEILISHGADLEARDGQGLTALHHASWRGHSEIVERLMEHGAAVNKKVKMTAFTAFPTEEIAERPRGYTALYLATQMKHWTVMEQLVSAEGVDRAEAKIANALLSLRNSEAGVQAGIEPHEFYLGKSNKNILRSPTGRRGAFSSQGGKLNAL